MAAWVDDPENASIVSVTVVKQVTHACVDSEFHGHWHLNIMNITPVEQIPTAIDLAVNMRAHLLQLRTTFTKPFEIPSDYL